MTFISYAQNLEDVMLWRALRHVNQGFWIDVGAADPDLLSVTHAFSKRGWRGINIEPAERPLRLLQQFRPGDINLQMAAGDGDGEIRLFTVDDANGLTTTDAAVAARHAADGHIIAEVMAPVTTLATICAAHVDGPIHFLKIDVEGGEKAVISGADFARFRPWIVVVESTAPNSQIQTHREWEPQLLDAHYQFAWFDGLNRFYVAEEHAAELLPHFQAPPNVFDDFVRAVELAASSHAGIEADLTRAVARAAESEAVAEAAIARVLAAEAAQALTAARAHAAEARAQACETRARAYETETDAALDAAMKATVDAAADADMFSARAESLEARLHATEAQLNALLGSKSWRLTRPVRSIAYRVYQLLRHSRLSGLRRVARRFPRRDPTQGLPLSYTAAPVEAPEWEMTSFRLLDDDARMTARVNAALTFTKTSAGGANT